MTGTILALGFGPVFFSILQSSIEKGWSYGLLLATGTCSSDLILAFGTYFIFQGQSEINLPPLFRVLGALVLATFGIFQWVRKPTRIKQKTEKVSNRITYFFKGIMLNLGNPLNILTWFTITLVLRSFKLSQKLEVIHILGIIAVVFTIEFLLAFGTSKFKDRFTPLHIRRLRIFMGFIFLAAAIKLLSTVSLQQLI